MSKSVMGQSDTKWLKRAGEMTDHCGTLNHTWREGERCRCRDKLLSCRGGMSQAFEPNKELFQIVGMSTAATERLKSSVRKAIACGRR